MTNRELEQRLAQAVDRTAPDDWEGVLSRCKTRKGNVIPMTTTPKWKIKALAAACLAVLLAGGGGLFYQQTQAIASTVSLDVNPSIELKVNRGEKVLACTPLNSDAAQVLFEMNSGSSLKGVQLDVAVNAIVGSLLRHGYLDGISSAILISVEDNDQARATRLQHQVTGTVGAALQAQAATANVMGQTLTASTGLAQQAQKSSISTGRAALVNQAIALNGSLSFEQLALLSVEELKDLIESGAPGMPIGAEAARKAAEDYAGLAAEGADIDPELDKTPAYYEVDLYYTSHGKLEYKVDAYTGKVLTGQAKIQENTSTGVVLTEAQAKEAALKYMSAQYPALQGQAVQDGGVHLAWDKGRQIYEVAFTWGGSRFECDINAATGAMMDWDTNYVQTTQSAASGTAYIGQEAAKAAALAHAGFAEGDVTYCNSWMEYDDGHPEHYEVEFATKDARYEYEISLFSSAILKFEKKPYRSQSAPASPTASVIGEAAAKAAALKPAGLTESQVSGLVVKRDYDDGRLEYDVDFWQGSTEYEYTIDGSSGAVIKVERDLHGAPPSSSTPSGAGASGDIGEAAAKAAALKHAGLSESQVTALVVKKDYDDGRLEYDVDFWQGSTEYQYTIDGSSGGVLEFEKDVHQNASPSSGDIGQAGAKAAALKHAGLSESQVYKLKVERDYDDGRLEYDVEFDYGHLEYEYTIDGATGAILEYEVDD